MNGIEKPNFEELPAIYDFDMRGGIDRHGEFNQVFNQEALVNSIRMWLASRPQELLRRPGRGGQVYRAVGSAMNEDTQENLDMAIRNGLSTDFRPYLRLRRLEIIPIVDKRIKYWKIYMEVDAPDLRVSATIDEKVKARV